VGQPDSQTPSPGKFRCPTCRKRFSPAGFFPFCSDRCKTIDLARWLDGAYQIPVKPNPGEEDADPATQP
jgi:uncharacterized protein